MFPASLMSLYNYKPFDSFMQKCVASEANNWRATAHGCDIIRLREWSIMSLSHYDSLTKHIYNISS